MFLHCVEFSTRLFFVSPRRVSDFLAEGYILYGNPVMVMDNGNRIVGQAEILPDMVQDHQALRQDQSL